MKRKLLIASCITAAMGCASSGVDRTEAEEWRVGETVDRVEASPAAGEVEFVVHTPVGVDRSQMLFSAQDVIIGDASELRAPDQSHRTNIFGQAIVGVEAGATVGSVYGNQISIDENAKIAGVAHASANEADSYSWRVSFAEPAAPGVTLEKDQTMKLDPGAYESLHVRAGAAVILRPGVYHLGALDVEENGVLEIDNSEGAVMVWLKDGLRMSGTMVHDAPAANVLVGYAGTETPEISGAFRGVLVAPNASVRLPATKAPHAGSFFAQTIEVESGAVIYQVPFMPNAVDYVALNTPGAYGQGGWTNPLQFMSMLLLYMETSEPMMAYAPVQVTQSLPA